MFRLPKIPPQYREVVDQARAVLERADNALEVLWQARGGTRLDVALAGASILGETLKLLSPDESPHETLSSMGYQLIDTGVGNFLCRKLQHIDGLHTHHMHLGDAWRITFWGTEGGPRAVAALYVDDEFEDGPYVQDGDDELFIALVRHSVWQHRDQVLSPKADRGNRSHWTPSDYQLKPMPSVNGYIGEPPIEWYVERMRRYSGRSRTVRLKGPTGVGKSTLARLLGKSMLGEEARTLKITSASIEKMPIEDIVDLAHYLAPDVLVLDDFIPSGGRRDDDGAEHLAFLESLHDVVPLTVITEMTEGRRAVMRQHRFSGGKNYVAGIRPGRVDETFDLDFPSARVRKMQLEHFARSIGGLAAMGMSPALLDDIVQRTDGLTGAYLKELVARLGVMGLSEYMDEIERLLHDAPPVPSHIEKRRKKAHKKRTRKLGDRPALSTLDRAELDRVARKLGVGTDGNMGTVRERIKAHWAEQDRAADAAAARALLDGESDRGVNGTGITPAPVA